MFEKEISINPGTVRHTIETEEPFDLKSKHNQFEGNSVEFTLKSPAVVRHPEHHTIPLPAGKITAKCVMEYDPWQEAMRPVFD